MIRRCLSLLAAASVVGAVSSAEAGIGQLVFSGEVGGTPRRTIEIVVEKKSATASALVFLQHKGAGPLKGVTLEAGPFRKSTSQENSGVAVTFKIGGAVPKPGGFDVPIAPKQAILRLTVSGLSPGLFTGPLLVAQAGRVVRVALVKIRVGPLLSVAGVTEDDRLTFERSGTVFRATLRVDSTSGTAGEIQAHVDPLVGPGGREHPVKVVGSPTSLTPLGHAEFPISATVSEEGTYTGTLILAFRGVRQTLPIVVTRKRLAPSVGALDVGRARRSFSFRESFRGGDVGFAFTIDERAGSAVTGHLSIVRLKRDSQDVQEEAEYDRVEFKELGESGAFTLTADQTRRIRVVVKGLTDPGEYAGAVRLSVPGRPPVEQPLTLSVRRSMWFAAMFIALGLATSFLVRLLQTMTSRSTRVLQIAALAPGLNQLRNRAKEGPERDLVDRVVRIAADLSRDVSYGLIMDPKDQLDVLRRQIELAATWIGLWEDAADPEELRKLADDLVGARSLEDTQKVQDDLERVGVPVITPMRAFWFPGFRGGRRRSDPELQMPSPKRVRLRLAVLQLALSALVLGVAVVLGLQFLYAGKPAWGSLLEIGAAFLWGLGLNELGKAAFTGVDPLRKLIVEGPPPAK